VLEESGISVSGNRDMVFRLHSDYTCATQVGTDIVKNNVQVVDGQFSMFLQVDQADFDGQRVFLEAEVAGTSIGCQPIRAVPYALGLRLGAIVSGTMAAEKPPLEVLNSQAPGSIDATGIRGLSRSGELEDIHPAGSWYTADGEFAGPNGVMGASYGDALSGYGVIGLAGGIASRAVFGQATSRLSPSRIGAFTAWPMRTLAPHTVFTAAAILPTDPLAILTTQRAVLISGLVAPASSAARLRTRLPQTSIARYSIPAPNPITS
jgi:hypothetical protein